MLRLLLFLQLSWLCIRLCLHLLFFSWQLVLIKLNKQYVTVFFICLCIVINLLIGSALWQHKQTPLITVINGDSTISLTSLDFFEPKTLTLTPIELQKTIEIHQLLEKQGIMSQVIYANLNQLTQFSDQNQADNYLQKAKRITP